MRCPACGSQNNDLATRCATCGAALSGTSQTPSVTAPPTSDEKPLRRRRRREGGRFGAFVSTHQRALGLGIGALVIVGIGIAWLVVSLTNAPTYEQIQADLAALAPTYAYAGGDYGTDTEVPLSGVVVTQRNGTQAPAADNAVPGVGPAAFEVQAEATYDNEQVRVTRTVAATYVRSKDGWLVTGSLSDRGISLQTHAGVNEDKVLAHAPDILAATGSLGGASLAQIYANGTFGVVSTDFHEAADDDPATDDVVLTCSASQGFQAYSGSVMAHFAFEGGTWKLSSAEADANATSRSFEPLIGTWVGTFRSQEARGASCNGAQEYPLVVTIDSVSDPDSGSGQVRGSLSGLAHFHKQLAQDQNGSPQDAYVEGLAFSGTLSTTSDGTGITMVCTTAGDRRGEVGLTLTFGSADDPLSATALVTTTYEYDDTVWLVVSRKTTARFSDTYALVRSDESSASGDEGEPTSPDGYDDSEEYA